VGAVLRKVLQARVTFIDKIAALVANKLFECGLIP
jgi:acetone carboxylase gamma subunit